MKLISQQLVKSGEGGMQAWRLQKWSTEFLNYITRLPIFSILSAKYSILLLRLIFSVVRFYIRLINLII
jgi:hypothetical protein